MSAPDSAPSASYLSKLSPWSRSPVMPPSKGRDGEPEPLRQSQPQGVDHVVSHRHRLSLRKYPRDCPPLRPCWFHAVDVPKRRPHLAPTAAAASGGETTTDHQQQQQQPPPQPPAAQPKKYTAFSVRDSKAIEAAFQKLLDEEEGGRGRDAAAAAAAAQLEQQLGDISLQGLNAGTQANANLADDKKTCKVPVNEDYLFDVDVDRRELAPAYWLGPVYDVRRGTWFYQDGSTQRPCDENLAAQLEEGYLKVKPWRFPPPTPAAAAAQKPRSVSQPRRPTSWTPGEPAADAARQPPASTPLTPQVSAGDLRSQATKQAADKIRPSEGTGVTEPQQPSQNTYRLFGAHMNSVVTYQDASTAWLLTDDFMSRMNYSVYQRFAGGGHFAGIKLTRGFVYPEKKAAMDKDEKAEKAPAAEKAGKATLAPVPPPAAGEKRAAGGDASHKDGAQSRDPAADDQPQRVSTSETRRLNLQRQMSSLLEDPSAQEDKDKQDEEVRRRDEREIEDDYREAEGDEQGREIEHLILVTHGIGQRLGLRLESVNFVHDVNTLRKTLKAVYADSPDLRALNAELGDAEHVNSRVQVLPICWRHLLDFPRQSLRHNRKEHDLADTDIDDEEFPNLDDITVEGVPAVRNLLTDLALDILLYQSPAYKTHISRIVVSECNRIYRLFLERNPTFQGKVSMIGHSLGSAIMFDILCRQGSERHATRTHQKDQHAMKLDFDVEDFYALGSPIGLFQMLAGRTIVAREKATGRKRATTTGTDEDLLGASSVPNHRKTSSTVGSAAPAHIDTSVSSPQCAQVFNIFHPTDPISYRIEPLISSTMASLKPQPLPYTKRGIFGAPMGQGLTGIGVRVSQSVSSMWSSMASNLLTRGLGYSGSEPTQASGNVPTTAKSSGPLSMSHGAGTSSAPSAGSGGSGGAVPPTAPLPPEGTEITKLGEIDKPERAGAGSKGVHPPTLIDAELETLYDGFQKNRKSARDPDAASGDLGAVDGDEQPHRAKKLKREEEKVRALNSNGRVDYAIQEGVFDINLIAAIASHLSYWSDEDVSHFVISQLLSRHRVVRPRASSSSGRGGGSGGIETGPAGS